MDENQLDDRSVGSSSSVDGHDPGAHSSKIQRASTSLDRRAEASR
jgi:hypothetical protein